ncbi:hypothetical protein CSKR_109757 [Clonorchis sinensis]|uniref:Uncharacterized protein n=1 Tax=Clonorchis sinensis TaxID=79923 RepID=A0A3R7GSB5_CLOSI|nr:hypothetical protein CSKR_109757 [Clonorchis sinensis]
MTSVFNTDASLSYNHDLFESLVVKKRVKVDFESQAQAGSRGPLSLKAYNTQTLRALFQAFLPSSE